MATETERSAQSVDIEEKEMLQNTAKRLMLEGKPALGAGLGAGSPLAAEMMAGAGFDWMLLDDQHGLWSPEATMAAFHNIVQCGSIPMARVQKNDFGLIGSLLDKGALGIVVPMVNSAADAEACAYAMRYPPRGGRSIGVYGYRMYELSADAYVRASNDEVFLAVQIESKQAFEQVDAIMSVDGVDGCWIGPADLGASMGLNLQNPTDARLHHEAILRIRDACRRAGKIPGIAGGDNGQYWIEQGFQFVTVAWDLAYLIAGSAETLRRLRDVRTI
jgi:4-hydroxy-2-oxoheptanedioate aldolase